MPSGRFFGGVIGGSIPAAIAADWLTSTWDQNAGLTLPTPAAGIVEEVAGTWLKELLGLFESASFGFVTGCQMAHFSIREPAFSWHRRGIHRRESRPSITSPPLSRADIGELRTEGTPWIGQRQSGPCGGQRLASTRRVERPETWQLYGP